jgi:DNA (cytosine-5)-methyltransferase 1
MGYHNAGFEVVGVDLAPQPNYPFEFHQANALEFPLDGFDAIAASPPCQAYSTLRALGKQEHMERFDLVAPVRERLINSGLPFAIENVVGAPLINPIRLCGTMFGLGVQRHRLFETNVPVAPIECGYHDGKSIGVYGDHPQYSFGYWKNNRASSLETASEAMGINWMTWREITQAIPPAYTKYIGEALLCALRKGTST